MPRRDDHRTNSVDGAAAFDRDWSVPYWDGPDMGDFTKEELADMPKDHLRRLGYKVPDDPWAGGAK